MAFHHHFGTHYSTLNPVHPLNQFNPASPYYHLYHSKNDVLVQPHQAVSFEAQEFLVIGGCFLTAVLIVAAIGTIIRRISNKKFDAKRKQFEKRWKNSLLKPKIERE